jgi:hypothetical protein
MIFNKLFLLLAGAASVTRQAATEPAPPGAAAPAPSLLLPASIYTYDVGTGAISCASRGVVRKHWANNGHDTTTLATFAFPAALGGRTCQLRFRLAAADVCAGSRKLDVFTALRPVAGCPTAQWPPNSGRDRHLGRMDVRAGGWATWEAKYGTYLTEPTPCPHGVTLGMEFVGVYDDVDIEWSNPLTGGPRIHYW